MDDVEVPWNRKPPFGCWRVWWIHRDSFIISNQPDNELFFSSMLDSILSQPLFWGIRICYAWADRMTQSLVHGFMVQDFQAPDGNRTKYCQRSEITWLFLPRFPQAFTKSEQHLRAKTASKHSQNRPSVDFTSARDLWITAVRNLWYGRTRRVCNTVGEGSNLWSQTTAKPTSISDTRNKK